MGLRENIPEEATLAKFLWMRKVFAYFYLTLPEVACPPFSPRLPLSHYSTFFAWSMHHYLRLSSAFICLLIHEVCVPFPKSQVLQEKGLICFIHCYIPNAANTARHMVGAQATLTEWMDPFYFFSFPWPLPSLGPHPVPCRFLALHLSL